MSAHLDTLSALYDLLNALDEQPPSPERDAEIERVLAKGRALYPRFGTYRAFLQTNPEAAELHRRIVEKMRGGETPRTLN